MRRVFGDNHGLRIDRTQHSLVSANGVLVCITEYRGIPEKPTIIITIQGSPFITLCLGSIELDRVISEPCYKGIIL